MYFCIEIFLSFCPLHLKPNISRQAVSKTENWDYNVDDAIAIYYSSNNQREYVTFDNTFVSSNTNSIGV